MLVVSDTGPLISLMKAGQLSVLESLFGEVVIPVAVFDELTSAGGYPEEAALIRNSGFIKVVVVEQTESMARLRRDYLLDAGEIEAIAFAYDNGADVTLIEDGAAKRAAEDLGLHVMGAVGVLVKSCESGALSTVEAESAFAAMRMANRHISEAVYSDALQKIREAGLAGEGND